MSIIKITEHDDHATVECSKADGRLFLNSPALWDSKQKAWLIEVDKIGDVTAWLRRLGHTIVRDHPTGPPQPPPYQPALDELTPEEQIAINARGLAAARAALRQDTPS